MLFLNILIRYHKKRAFLSDALQNVSRLKNIFA